jgi:hypothetical protein
VDAGFLQLVHVPVRFLLYRPFMRISYNIEGLSYALTIDQYSLLRKMAIESIAWADGNEDYIQTWFVAIYALFICSLLVVRVAFQRSLPSN